MLSMPKIFKITSVVMLASDPKDEEHVHRIRLLHYILTSLDDFVRIYYISKNFGHFVILCIKNKPIDKN